MQPHEAPGVPRCGAPGSTLPWGRRHPAVPRWVPSGLREAPGAVPMHRFKPCSSFDPSVSIPLPLHAPKAHAHPLHEPFQLPCQLAPKHMHSLHTDPAQPMGAGLSWGCRIPLIPLPLPCSPLFLPPQDLSSGPQRDLCYDCSSGRLCPPPGRPPSALPPLPPPRAPFLGAAWAASVASSPATASTASTAEPPSTSSASRPT